MFSHACRALAALRQFGGILAVLLLAGCNDGRLPTAPVRGTVYYDGFPLHTGTVTFIPQQAGPSATGEIQPDGTVVMSTYEPGDGATIGTHDVIVVAIDTGSVSGLPENPVEPLLLVPRKYGSPQTSGLSVTVKQHEANSFELKLEPKSEPEPKPEAI